MTEQRFIIRMHKDAAKEYKKLNHSAAVIVDKALERLEVRADEIGKELGHKRNINLTGCKEVKLRDAGIRIVFTITKEYVNILQVAVVIAVAERDDDYVFKLAGKRLNQI